MLDPNFHPEPVRPRTFALVLRALPGVDGPRALRGFLKTALRRFGLRCVDAREITEQEGRS